MTSQARPDWTVHDLRINRDRPNARTTRVVPANTSMMRWSRSLLAVAGHGPPRAPTFRAGRQPWRSDSKSTPHVDSKLPLAGYVARPKVLNFLDSCGISPVRASYRSAWQNGVAERWVRSIRNEVFDHVIVINESHLRRLAQDYLRYYHQESYSRRIE